MIRRNTFPRWLMAAVATVMLVLLAGGVWFCRAQERHVQQETERELQAIAQLKANQIAAWRAERLADAAVLTQSPFLCEGVARWIADPTATREKQVLTIFRSLRDNYQYSDVLLADTSGKLLLGLSARVPALHKEAAQALAIALRNRKPVLTDLHADADQTPHLEVLAPLFHPNAQAIGALILQIDARKFLYPLVQSWPTPRRSAETLLVRRDGDAVLFLNDLRQRTNTALKLRIPLTQTGVPAVMAVRGKEGIVPGKDYRGVAVLSVLKAVPDSPWFIVAKVDAAEAFAIWRLHAALILALVAAAAAVVGVVWQRNAKAQYRALFQSEAALRRSELLNRSLLEHLPHRIFIKDRNSVYVSCNANYARDLGIQPEQVVGKNDSTLYPRELAEMYRADDQAVMTTQTPNDIVQKYVVGGQERWLRTIKVPYRDEQGQVVGVVGMLEDITQRKRAEDEVRALKTQIEFILGATKTGLDIIDAQFHICYIDPEWQKVYGDPTGRKCFEYFMGRGEPCPDCGIVKALKDKAIAVTEEVLVKENSRPIQVTTIPFQNERGEWLVAEVNVDITERKRADQALRESEERYRVLFEGSAQGILVADVETRRFVYANPSICRMLGYTQEELVQLGVQDVHPKDFLEHVVSEFDAQARQEKTLASALPCQRKDGSVFYADVSTAPAMIHGRKCNVGFFADVTERKRAEEALRRSDSLNRSLVEHLPQRIFIKDRNCVYVSCNANYARDLGIQPEQIAGQDDFAFFPRDLADLYRADDQAVMTSGTPKDIEEKYLVAGQERWVHTSKVPYRDAQGQVVGVVGIFEDVTERKHAETQLRESQERLNQVLAAAQDAVIMLDPQGNISMWNDSAARIFGYSAQEALGQHLHELLAPARFQEDYRNGLAHFRRTGQGAAVARVLELTALRKSGEEFPIELSLSSVNLESGWHAIGIVRDITERKQAEKEKQKLQAQLLQAHKLESVGQLAAGIAHEINTPTQYVGDNVHFLQAGFADLARLQETLDRLLEQAQSCEALSDIKARVQEARKQLDLDYLQQEIPRALNQATEGIGHICEIVMAMKEFSHPGGKEKKTINLNDAIRSTVTVARNEWKYVADMDLDLDENLPLVPCLPGEVNQALLNLLVNAAQAIGQKVGDSGQKGRIRIQTRADRQTVEIRVSDSGTGIPPTIQNRIFDPFFTTKGVGRGTGQGLTIAHSVVVDKHGGTLEFETAEGEGTTFIIRLPLQTPNTVDNPSGA